MTSRFASLAAVLLLMLSFSSADAAELQRRVTMTSGTVYTGTIVERGAGYIVLKRTDGSAVELSLESIDEIEVITGDSGSDPGWSKQDSSADEPDEPVRFETDWADEANAEDRDEWSKRYDGATGGHALSVAPGIPLMSLGLIELASGPMAVGGLNTGVRVGMGVIGGAFLAGSIGVAAGGAKVARDAYGLPRDPTMIRLGIAFGLLGSGGYAASWALAHGIWTGEVPDQNLSASPAVGVLIGTSMGAVIVGNILLMQDAKKSKELAYDEYERTKPRRRRASAQKPYLASAWLTPQGQGLVGGVTLGW
jgi:hypothetical protein